MKYTPKWKCLRAEYDITGPLRYFYPVYLCSEFTTLNKEWFIESILVLLSKARLSPIVQVCNFILQMCIITPVALQRYSRTVYGTLYSTFTMYVVLSRCYGVTKARPCTGRTLYKCLHTSLNLGKHIKSSCLLVLSFFSCSLFFFLFSFFLFSSYLRSYDQVYKHRLHWWCTHLGYGPTSTSLAHNDYSTSYPINRYTNRRTY